MINSKHGSILNATENVIIQQVNCRGVMGAGLGKQIAKMYPEVLYEYKKVCSQNKSNPKNLLGETLLIKTLDKNKVIANIFGQDKYGRSNSEVYTEYNALERGFTVVKQYAENKNLSIAIPYCIGCGLGNGDWDYILKLIKQIYEGGNVEVTIYRI